MLKLLPLLLLVSCTTANQSLPKENIDEYFLAHKDCSTYAEHIWLCNGLTPQYVYVEHYSKKKCPRQEDGNGLWVVKCTALNAPDYLF